MNLQRHPEWRDRGRRERAAGVEAMKFYEVAPHLNLTQHAVSIRPICFSVKTLKTLPKELQEAIFKAGKEAGDYGRKLESSEEVTKLDTLEKAASSSAYRSRSATP